MVTIKLKRWSRSALLLLLTAGMGAFCQGHATQLPRKEPYTASAIPQVACTNERVTVKAKSVPLDAILDSIARACQLKILSPSAEKTKNTITLDLFEVDISDALGEVLRGCDYLVVYNELENNTGFSATAAPIRIPSNQESTPTEAVMVEEVPMSLFEEKQAQADYLRGQIETLNERISSGDSDRFYQQALKHKRPEFIHDDRKELAQYQKELIALEQQ